MFRNVPTSVHSDVYIHMGECAYLAMDNILSYLHVSVQFKYLKFIFKFIFIINLYLNIFIS